MVKNEMQAQNGRMEARTKWLSKVLEVLMEVIGDTFSKYLFETALWNRSHFAKLPIYGVLSAKSEHNEIFKQLVLRINETDRLRLSQSGYIKPLYEKSYDWLFS